MIQILQAAARQQIECLHSSWAALNLQPSDGTLDNDRQASLDEWLTLAVETFESIRRIEHRNTGHILQSVKSFDTGDELELQQLYESWIAVAQVGRDWLRGVSSTRQLPATAALFQEALDDALDAVQQQAWCSSASNDAAMRWADEDDIWPEGPVERAT